MNPPASTSNNRLNGTTYDVAGNVITDAEGRSFTYDAENKQIEVENVSSQIVGQYYFDGDGKRIKKIVPDTGETTIFVYDASGKLVAEYSTVVASSQDAKTQYLTSDNLGTPRINTDSTGQVVSRSDYLPYGEEIVGLGSRSSGQGYAADDVRQGFTSYENDGETRLDYAQARMYHRPTGRFLSPDPYNIILEAKAEKDRKQAQKKLQEYLAKPQQWNRFAYVTNNPLVLVDPSGEVLKLSGTTEEKERFLQMLREMVGPKASKNIGFECATDGTWIVKYKGPGGLDVGGEFGVALQDIVDSSKVVSLSMTGAGLESNGGAITSLNDDNSKITIKISYGVVDTAERVLKGQGYKGTDGKDLKFTLSVAVAHELGHAWGFIRDRTGERFDKLRFYQSSSHLRLENQDRAVQLENLERQRLGLALRWRH